ncbi:hypothetical protein HZZ00_11030 [Streptomyces sp. NEAU-sy36]|uniref:hypothetical protein n=1 Tax=unclassified Streptomyces TaxID=2593676 RepID=UPI0015D63E6E|nr:MULTISPECIES: hypothetical protein [unclassified Streptomyces]QLJ01504.1 hypothetical protein HZZ00_11030 [Streptomyces sp. NEAU-sy36]
MDASAACIVCARELYDTEVQTCRLCAERVASDLRALAGPDGLYARLADSLAPGSGSGGPAVSGSRTAPLPVRLGPLSLAARGGIVTVLQTWLIDWHDLLAYTHPRWDGDLQQQLDQVVGRLLNLLPWAAENHGAFDEFVGEVAGLVHQSRAATGEEKPPRRIGVQCACGTTLKVTLDTAGIRCPGCSTQYGHSEALRLPLSERRAA